MKEQKILEEIGKVSTAVAALTADLDSDLEQRDEEIKRIGKATEETGKKADAAAEGVASLLEERKGLEERLAEVGALQKRLDEVEARFGRPGLPTDGAEEDVAAKVLGSPAWEPVRKGSSIRSDRINVGGGLMRLAGFPAGGRVPQGSLITSTIASPGRLVLPQRVEEVMLPKRALRFRDIVRVRQMTGAEISYIRETGFHAAASQAVGGITRAGELATVTLNGHGYQSGNRIRIAGADQAEYNKIAIITVLTANTFTYRVSGAPATPATGAAITATNVQTYGAAAAVAEGGLLPEATLELAEVTQTPRRIGHWIPATKRVLADDAMMRSRIEDRLPYGILFREELQGFFGDGTGQNLTGLASDPDSQIYSWSEGVTGDTRLDAIRRAMTLVTLAEWSASAVAMGNSDWQDIELLKGTDNHYILIRDGAVGEGASGRVWRVPVVATNAFPGGQFLTGPFDMVTLWDREDAEIFVADQHADYALRGQVALIAEEWVCLENPRPEAFVVGTWDAAPA